MVDLVSACSVCEDWLKRRHEEIPSCKASALELGGSEGGDDTGGGVDTARGVEVAGIFQCSVMHFHEGRLLRHSVVA